MKGVIFSIKRYAINDGPGIRVAFFLKGCPLSCWWCHNPEGISPDPEEVSQVNRVGEKEFRKTIVAGRLYEPEEIISILDRERVFIERSGGGVTFTGGEPLMQPDFLRESIIACRESGYHTAVDTSGCYPASRLKKIIPFTDLFLYDIKHPDPDQHKFYTGVSNKQVLANLRILINNRKEIIIRIPVIPGMNDGEKHIEGFLNILNSFGKETIKGINLLPFHRTGSAKYAKFGRVYRMEGISQPADNRMKDLKEIFSTTGINVKIGG